MDSQELFSKIQSMVNSLDIDDKQRDEFIKGLRELQLQQSEHAKYQIQEFTFDLNTKALKEYYPQNSINSSWNKIGEYLKNKGFEKKSDSDYVSKTPMSMLQLDEVLDEMKNEFPWFELCSKKALASILTEQSDIKQRWEKELSAKSRSKLEDTLIFNKQNKDLALPSGFIVTSKSKDSLVSGKILVEPKEQIKGCNLKYILDMDRKEATLVINEKPMGIKPLNKDTISKIKNVYEKAKHPGKEVDKEKVAPISPKRDDDFER